MTNPWTIGHENFLEYLNSQISAWVDEKNMINENTGREQEIAETVRSGKKTGDRD